MNKCKIISLYTYFLFHTTPTHNVQWDRTGMQQNSTIARRPSQGEFLQARAINQITQADPTASSHQYPNEATIPQHVHQHLSSACRRLYQRCPAHP